MALRVPIFVSYRKQRVSHATPGWGAKEAQVGGWDLGPSALESMCLGQPHSFSMLTLTDME